MDTGEGVNLDGRAIRRAAAIPVLFFLLLVCILPVTAATWTYGGNTSTGSLQDLINKANASDTIVIKGGTYPGNIVIDRPLVLQAEDPVNPPKLVIRNGTGINITAKGVILDGIDLSGNGICGILIQSDNNKIANTSVSGFAQGLCLAAAVNNEFIHNTLVNNSVGIALDRDSQVNEFSLNYLDNTVDVVSSSPDTTWSSRPWQYQYGGKIYTGSLGNYWRKNAIVASSANGVSGVPYPVQANASGIQDSKNPLALTDRAPLVSPPGMYTLIGLEELQHGTGNRGTIPNSGPGTVPTEIGAAPTEPGTIRGGDVPGTGGYIVTGPGISGPGGSLTTGPPPFPGNLVQYWWIVPIALIISAGAGIWYGRRRRGPDEQQDSERKSSGKTTVIKKTIPQPDGESNGLHHYVARLPPGLERKYPGAEYIAEGGASRIFRARDPIEGRDVAVKVPIRFDEVTGTQFTKELHVWQSLHHKNIVEIYAANIFPVPYIEMEYVDSSLASVKFPVSHARAIEIIQGVAEGLRYAHEQGIAHRDIKPGNILIDPEGVPKITDWGLAKAEGTKQSGIIGFSLEYAAPEQLAPNIYGEPGIWTDIYQLGVLFYELTTGQVPFRGGGMGEITHAILHDDPPGLGLTGPGSSEMEKIILRCMQKYPKDRYPSVSEIIADLERIQL